MGYRAKQAKPAGTSTSPRPGGRQRRPSGVAEPLTEPSLSAAGSRCPRHDLQSEPPGHGS